MNSAIFSPRSTTYLSQRRRSLLELSEKLRELADMQVKLEKEDVESVTEFRDIIHQLCQEEPAVAQAIAAAIRENIPDPSRIASKYKRRQDPSYRPSHTVQSISRKKQCTADENTVEEPMTPESAGPGSGSSETEDASHTMIRLDTDGLRIKSQHESKADVRPTTLTMVGDNAAKSDTSHCNSASMDSTRQRTESPFMPEQGLTECVSFLDTVHQMVDIVHLFNRHQTDLPRTVHRRILQSLQTTQEPTVDLKVNQWSDGRMWMEVLERGSATNRRCSILNMLEYMGASKWYDSQIEHAKRTVCTIENKPVGEKGAATYVLDRITQEHSLLSRKTITNQCFRGKRLRELVESIGLGILISPKIWDYTKRKGPHFNQLVQDLKADTQRLALFQVLTPQVEKLVHKGCTDPEALYGALRDNNIISADELQEIKAKYLSESGSTSAVTLNKAVDRLTSQISTHVLKKRKLDADDTLSINGSVELSIDIFARLRAGEWLDSWALMAAMQISDRPDFVKFGESIPLDSFGRHGQMRSIKRPFQTWAKRIISYRRDAEGGTPLIFYCPVNHSNSHFTLLEINDGEKAIRHYDSQAPLTAINGTKKTRIAALIEDEFGDLGYMYTEAPTPQQRDGWSCGTRVVWNFRRLSNGFDIGSWDTVLSSERMNMDILSAHARDIQLDENSTIASIFSTVLQNAICYDRQYGLLGPALIIQQLIIAIKRVCVNRDIILRIFENAWTYLYERELEELLVPIAIRFAIGLAWSLELDDRGQDSINFLTQIYEQRPPFLLSLFRPSLKHYRRTEKQSESPYTFAPLEYLLYKLSKENTHLLEVKTEQQLLTCIWHRGEMLQELPAALITRYGIKFS
uniref:Ubiquitin-like protease family profile domain-containing protein n=1 Tax=Talaromyces marneffei PM1 TaxID=1077442 RepID=A0A093V2V6_TALMA